MAYTAKIASCIDQCLGALNAQPSAKDSKKKRTNHCKSVSLSSIPEWKDDPEDNTGLFCKIPYWFILELAGRIGCDTAMIYQFLMAHRNRKGYAWPSVSTIAKKLRLGATTVKARLRLLESHGLIQGRRNKGTSTSFYLPPLPK